MSIKKIVLVMGLSALIAGCATGGYNSRIAAYQSEGSARMGMRYLLGRGVPQSDTKAFANFHRAANEGDPFAQNELAYLYASGKGTRRNAAQAFHWYQKAANHGLASAQYNLGLLYEYGMGTTPNKALAKKWIQKSAAHGFEPAKKFLGQL